ncbi:hypothetical protein T01_16090 [Trichinella spiralis]|uniref:Uncharacterized protein n=1 Tax=Trichinella spiralis TaxID=6334 RepID=A0A0V1B9Q4_TRISP|nr:hypothetical protein T01_16090 [Trichinella spiralis]
MPLRPINLFDNSDEEESRARCPSLSCLQFVAFYHRQPVDWNPQASDISAERSYIFSINFTCWEQQNEKTVYLENRRAAVGEVPYPLVNIGSVLKLVEFYEC